MEKKKIYEFEVENMVEEEVRQEKVNKKTGETETVIKKEKVNKPCKFFFYKPSRKSTEEMHEEYSIALSTSISKGIMTKAMLSKRYRDNGGAHTKEEQKKLDSLYDEYKEVTKTSFDLEVKKKRTKKEEAELSDLNSKSRILQSEILEIESQYRSLFNDTAEVRAENAATKSILLENSFYQNPEDGKVQPLFAGDDIDERSDSFYKILDLDDKVFNEGIEDLMIVVAAWYFNGEEKIEETVQMIKEGGA